MKVKIKQFDVEMEIKTKPIELDIRKPNGSRLGDLVINKSSLIWCKGKTTPGNGVKVSWGKFIQWMENR